MTMTKTRLPINKRAKDPPRMILTQRDEEIIGVAYAYRFVTSSQINTRVFLKGEPPKETRCNKRLRLLYHHGFLDRILPKVARGEGAKPIIYCLDERGAQLLAEELEGEVDWRPKDREVGKMFLDHTLKINDVRIAVTLAAEKAGFQLRKWTDEKTLKSQEMKDYVTISTPGGRKRKVAVIPDGYFILNIGEKKAHFFIEVDLATLSNTRWKTKIQAYLAYIRQGLYQKRYRTRSLRILTVTTGERRLQNLKTTTEAAEGQRMFWFTTFDQATSDKILTEPIWQVATSEGLHSLIR